MAVDYSSEKYWNDRYSKDLTEFDYYLTFDEIKEVLVDKNVLGDDKEIEIFIPGVGTSSLPESLHKSGYSNVTCVDSSQVLVNHLMEKNKHLHDAEFLMLNMIEFSHGEYYNKYDVIIDKAFTDSLFCSSDDFQAITKVITCFYQILKKGKTFVCISHGAPETRLPYISPRNDVWSKIDCVEIPKSNLMGHHDNTVGDSYYIYFCTK